jgi:hypothetical protein
MQQKKIFKGYMVLTRPNIKGMVSGEEYLYQKPINYFCERVESFFACFLFQRNSSPTQKKFLGRARMWRSILSIVAHLMIYEKCQDSNPVSCHGKRARYQLYLSTYLATHLGLK